VQFNEGEWVKCPQVTAVCVGNAKYFGGGMKITPNADPFTGNLEVKMPFYMLPLRKIIIYL